MVFYFIFVVKGLNDYLFDEQREKEKVMDVRSSKHYEESGSSDEEAAEEGKNENEAGGTRSSSNQNRHHMDDEDDEIIEGRKKKSSSNDTQPLVKKFNKYDLITNTKQVDLYVIDKEAYLKCMLTFTSDKSIANKYLDKLVRFILM